MTMDALPLAIPLLVVTIGAAGCGVTPSAGRVEPNAASQPFGDSVLAREDFEEGKRAMEKGDYARACEKFESSDLAVPRMITKYWRGLCSHKLGNLATAWYLLDWAMDTADATEAAEIRTLVDEILPKLKTRLVLEVPPAARVPDLELRRDGLEVPPRQWSRAVPVDPGEHRIVVTAPGRSPREVRVTIQEGETQRVKVELPMTWQKEAALVTGAVATAALLLGAAFGAATLVEAGPVNDRCRTNVELCGPRDPVFQGERNRLLPIAHTSTAGFVSGGVGAALALTFLLTSPSDRPGPSVAIVPAVGPTGAGLTVKAPF